MKPAKGISIFLLLVVSVIFGNSPSYAADAHYKWKDKWGNPVHSDRPPPKGVDYEIVASGTSLVRRVNSAEGVVPAKIDPTLDNKFEQIDTAKVETIEKNPEYCKRAQDNLYALNTSARIRMRDKDGEPYLLSEKDKETMRADALDVIEMHCD